MNGVPSWITSVNNDWNDKLFVSVLGVEVSSSSLILCGVRQSSSLSPSFFNTFINVLSVLLKLNRYGCCHINKCLVGVFFYADDIILLCASIGSLQAMLSICDSTLADLHMKFNNKKCFSVCLG